MHKRIAQIVAIGELIVAVPLFGVYTAPFRFIGAVGYWAPEAILTNILSIVFVVLPFVALYGVSKGWIIGYWAMGVFPIVAFAFGITAIPFVKYLYGSDVMVNSYIIGGANIVVVLSAVWLYKAGGLRSNQSLKSGTPHNGAP